MREKWLHNYVSKTHFAPAERDEPKDVLRQKELLEGSEFLNLVLARTPWMFVILNSKRQILYSNAEMVNFLGKENLEEMVGLRPGETMGCSHVHEGPGGCGTSASCSYCGVVQSILKSKRAMESVSEDTVVVHQKEGKTVHNELRVTSLPFIWKGELFFMVTFHDISSEKRKEQLERIFFHDILNKAGTITSLVNLLKEREESLSDNYVFELLERGVDEFIQDVIYQQKLQQAEAGNLEVSLIEVLPDYLIRTVVEDYSILAQLSGVTLQSGSHSDEHQLITDPVLLRRILGNLVKNAIEATGKTGEVKLDYRFEDDHITFVVSNPGVIPESVKSQLFTRSVSTKGAGRGLGTYSIRLFTEQYLQGKVWFTSIEGQGTEFSVSVPIRI